MINVACLRTIIPVPDTDQNSFNSKELLAIFPNNNMVVQKRRRCWKPVFFLLSQTVSHSVSICSEIASF